MQVGRTLCADSIRLLYVIMNIGRLMTGSQIAAHEIASTIIREELIWVCAHTLPLGRNRVAMNANCDDSPKHWHEPNEQQLEAAASCILLHAHDYPCGGDICSEKKSTEAD